MDPQQNSNPEVNPGATEGHTAAADREPNQEMEDLLNEEDLRAQEARRQAEGELWEKEPQRRTRSNVESVPDGRMGRAMQGAGKVLGGAVEFIFRMIRELLQGLFGKIMNKDLKGERENLEQEVEVQKREHFLFSKLFFSKKVEFLLLHQWHDYQNKSTPHHH